MKQKENKNLQTNKQDKKKKPLHNPEPTNLCTGTVLYFKVLFNRNLIYLRISEH